MAFSFLCGSSVLSFLVYVCEKKDPSWIFDRRGGERETERKEKKQGEVDGGERNTFLLRSVACDFSKKETLGGEKKKKQKLLLLLEGHLLAAMARLLKVREKETREDGEQGKEVEEQG